MRTSLTKDTLATAAGQEAERILRTCVHCGFCNATCPTYQLLGDELDGPRGRIYLIKQVLEGAQPGVGTRVHLDRCLTCRSCETTCPSGVQYGRLLDIGRSTVERVTDRPWHERLVRAGLRAVLPYPGRFGALLRIGQALRPLLPAALRTRVPARVTPAPWPNSRHTRTMILHEGCVQPLLAPDINAATARVLDKLGIRLLRVPQAGCCGAISQHLAAPEEARVQIRRLIDAWWPHVVDGAEAIVSTASGCGVMLKDYGHLLQDDPEYADKAARIAAMTLDVAEVLAREDLAPLARAHDVPARIAFHAPCTLQHGQRLNGRVEAVLARLGFELTAVADPYLCCGSAGTYSILQGGIARRLLRAKLTALEADAPSLIATANIGCLLHLQSAARVPVRHWIELLA